MQIIRTIEIEINGEKAGYWLYCPFLDGQMAVPTREHLWSIHGVRPVTSKARVSRKLIYFHRFYALCRLHGLHWWTAYWWIIQLRDNGRRHFLKNLMGNTASIQPGNLYFMILLEKSYNNRYHRCLRPLRHGSPNPITFSTSSTPLTTKAQHLNHMLL